MATAVQAAGGGLLDLEKELNCSICTEVLYQPLTLIDCLHTFCGSCLKEWFKWQYHKASKSRASDHGLSNPFTCPSCRASVKDARHNATVTTLLEMFLAVNPGRGKTEEEKQELAAAYTPGENILPQLDKARRSGRRARQEEAEAEDDRRLMEEVRERSLRETRGASEPNGGRLAAPNTAGETSRERSHERRQREERRERRREQERRERRRRAEETEAALAIDTAPTAATDPTTASGPPTTSPRHPDAVEARQRDRQIAHQSSLRSLMSVSESGTGTGDSLNEERILQQILDEGLLDNIDLHDLDAAQEDELSERIAEAYRQRHQGGDRSAPRQASTSGDREAGRTSDSERLREREPESQPRHYRESRSADRASTLDTRATPSTADSRHPPVSRPRLLEPGENAPLSTTTTASTANRRRASDQSRRNTSPAQVQRREATGPNPAARSTTDLSSRQQTADVPRTSRPRQTRRTSTDPDQLARTSDMWQQRMSENTRSQTLQSRARESSVPSSIRNDNPATEGASTTEPRRRKAHTTSETQLPPTRTHTQSNPAATSSTSLPPSRRHTPSPPPTNIYHEPLVNCARCARAGIQYELYKHCSKCSMDLCLRCYRGKRGCEHWFGFGRAAQLKFDASHPQNASGRAVQLPHVLVGRKYLRPPPESVQQSEQGTETVRAVISTSNPSGRLQEGKFCDRCHSFANACFWSCEYCNEGEWGFCNNCLITHHCCTHPLSPTAQRKYAAKKQSSLPRAVPDVNGGTTMPTPSALHISPATNMDGSRPSTAGSTQSQTMDDLDYLPVTIATYCDICSLPIHSLDNRFHCPSHASPTPHDPDNKGDYDICTNCFFNLVKTGQIKREDNSSGWRKCLGGHRMIVVGFEGPERVVINDLVGGHKLTEEDMAAISRAMVSPGSTAGSHNPAISGKWTWRESEGKRSSRARSLTLSSSSSSSSSASKFPPDGGYGKNCVASWTYYPEEGENGDGELLFPKGAEIREVEEVNEDWYYGVYAGDKGLFPAQYVRIWPA